ncbi:hypothetical protein HPB52_010220 [Rhipicephalus sanguineus]|uniref:Reverse transcriptase domain-containing protein n=1 Tax=Rhipicephalus sanguineus TaxID=34632 RepID=A0A9D4PII7_RHISA|nr:hypothetical protein HPB52_010220 [Rhipicephalus sanguineus]
MASCCFSCRRRPPHFCIAIVFASLVVHVVSCLPPADPLAPQTIAAGHPNHVFWTFRLILPPPSVSFDVSLTVDLLRPPLSRAGPLSPVRAYHSFLLTGVSPEQPGPSLLTCGDISPNPGPAVCARCDKRVYDHQAALCCDDCDRWCHRQCVYMSLQEYRRLGGCNTSWPLGVRPTYIQSPREDANVLVQLSKQTWLDASVTDSELFDTSGYTVLRKDRCGRGGGVLMAFPTPAKVNRRLDLEHDDLEALFVELIFKQYTNVLVFGDFNAHIDWTSHDDPLPHDRTDDLLLDIMTSANLVQACLEPTYSSRDGTSSSLDLVFVADPTRVTSCTTSEGLANSDHRAIEVCYAAVLPRNGHHARQLWKFDQTDHTHLARLAHLAPWCMTSSGDDCLGNYELWCDMALAIQRECVPSCTRTSKRRHRPWITPEIMKAARQKRLLFRKASRTQCPITFQLAKAHQRSLKVAIHVEHQRYTTRLAEKATENPKVFWSYVNSLRSSHHRPSFNVQGKLVDRPAEVSALFAEQFSSIYVQAPADDSELLEKFSPRDQGTHPTQLPDDSRDDSLLLSATFSPEALSSAISKINPSPSPGPDGMAPTFFRLLAPQVLVSLCTVFQSLLDHGTVPASWKRALVTPVHKGKSKPSNDPKNYRPHGFRRDRSCDTALATLNQIVSHNLDNRVETDVIQLDLSNAFDTLNISLLLDKAKEAGIRGCLLGWLANFLIGRSQRVLYCGAHSKRIPVPSGVPQGSVLAPTLFLIYVNNMPQDNRFPLVQYADDTSILAPILCPSTSEDLQEYLMVIDS